MDLPALAEFPDAGVRLERQLGGLGAERFEQMKQARIGRMRKAKVVSSGSMCVAESR